MHSSLVFIQFSTFSSLASLLAPRVLRGIRTHKHKIASRHLLKSRAQFTGSKDVTRSPTVPNALYLAFCSGGQRLLVSMATLSRIYSKCGVLSFVMFVGLIISLLFTFHTFRYIKNVDSNTMLSSSAIGQEISAKMHPMSKILDKVKDTVVRPLPVAPLAAATVLAPQPATPSQLLIPPAATAVQCAAVAPSGQLYPKRSIRWVWRYPYSVCVWPLVCCTL